MENEKGTEIYSFSSTQLSEKEMEMEMAGNFSEDHSRSFEDDIKKRKKGGFITIPFILANEAFEKTASYGLLPNMILYLTRGYNLSAVEGNKILFLWSAALNFMPVLGAFLADSYLGRFLTISLGCVFSLLGMIVLWLTAMIPQAKPPHCDPTNACKPATTGQFLLLISSFGIMSIGAGGIRSSSLAFGADQVERKHDPNNETIIARYFGWYYAVTCLSLLVAFTAVVYIQDQFGMKVGFGIPVILMFLSGLMFFLAAPLYVTHEAKESLISGIGRVIVAAFKNRKLEFPPLESGWYHHEKGSLYTLPSDKLRFLNKACIIRTPEDVTPSGVASNPWRLSTVKQVEELKALIRTIPLWSTGIMLSISNSQSTIAVLQANTMNRHITSTFQIPAGSFSMFFILTLTIWVVLYDRAILPLASKIKGKPVRISAKTRMGIGALLSAVSMMVSGMVEHARIGKVRDQANAALVANMSALWLAPQFCVAGLAEGLNAIGQIEFFYSEFPKSMATISSSLFGAGMAVGNLLATVVLSAVEKYTRGGGEGGESWVASDVNKGRYDYYYWLLGIMSLVNVVYFVICSWAYGETVEEIKTKEVEEDAQKQKDNS